MVDLQILDAGSGTGDNIGSIEGEISYNGQQGGDFVVRFFHNQGFSITEQIIACL